ncbi:MAG: murein biosynthesis integral membrane protein MurJ [Myxococcales bacterium]|nr:murein biosynthesis integral membrane protein MurJ [Myxococcales bacterium]
MSRRVIGVASLIYGVSILLSRLVGLIRESVIGRTLGDGPEADVYWTAFVLPDFLNYLLAGGVLSIVFIPMFQRYLAAGDEEGGWRAFSAIANVLTGLLLLATAALWALTPKLTPIIAPGLDAGQLVLLDRLVRIILPAQIFHLTGGLISATLQARDAHAAPAAAPVVYTGCIVAGGLLLGPTLGAEGFAWGVLAGSALGPFGLPLVAAVRRGLRWRLGLNLRHPDLRRYLLLSLPVMLGFSVVVLDDMVIKHYASSVAEGVISRLQYARTLMKVPMGVFGMAAGLAAFPTLSRLIAGGQREEAWRTLVGALRLMLLLAFTAQVGLTVAGTEIAAVVWGRARFTPAELADIGRYTGLLCLGLWAWSAQMLIARGFYAQGDTWTPTLVGSGVMAVTFPVYGLLADRAGGDGLALASSAAISLYLAALMLLLRRRLGRDVEGPGLLDALWRLALAAGGGIGVGLLLDRALPAWPALLRGALNGGVAALTCLALARALRLPEVSRLLGVLRRKLRRGRA